MPEETIAEDARLLLRAHIETYEQLLILGLVAHSPAAAWSPDALSARLKLAPSLVDAALAGLVAARLLEPRSGVSGTEFAFAAHDAGQAVAARHLANAYEERPVEVMKLMSANAIERVRTAAMRTFAEAFILRKDRGDG
jgi:hypothetical protein